MFLQVCVCPRREGVCLSACWDAIPPPRTRQKPPPGTRETPLGPGRHPPGPGRHTPRGTGRHTPPGPGRHPPGPGRSPRDQADTPQDQGDPPPREADSSIQSTSGRYASYWNAFLFINAILTKDIRILPLNSVSVRSSVQIDSMRDQLVI